MDNEVGQPPFRQNYRENSYLESSTPFICIQHSSLSTSRLCKCDCVCLCEWVCVCVMRRGASLAVPSSNCFLMFFQHPTMYYYFTSILFTWSSIIHLHDLTKTRFSPGEFLPGLESACLVWLIIAVNGKNPRGIKCALRLKPHFDACVCV